MHLGLMARLPGSWDWDWGNEWYVALWHELERLSKESVEVEKTWVDVVDSRLLISFVWRF
jgi:hypothetical protein